MALLRLNKYQKGFSLIEVVIASGILAVSLTSVMVLAVYTQRNSVFLLEKIFATLKASDGIEIVRHKRDTNLKDGNPATDWNYQLDQSGIETLNKTFTFANQLFKREVKTSASCVPAPCQIIESVVTWSKGKVEIKTQLTDWKLDS